MTTSRPLLGRPAEQVEVHADGDDERGADHRRRQVAGAGIAEAAAEQQDEQEPEQREGRDQPDDVNHDGTPFSASASGARSRVRPNLGPTDSDRMPQPFSSARSSAVAPGRRRRIDTMIPRPTTTSAAATTSTKNTAVWPPMSPMPRGQGDEAEVDGVEHQLDAHEHHERVAPHEHADGADAEQHGGRGSGTTSGSGRSSAITTRRSRRRRRAACRGGSAPPCRRRRR